MFDEIEEGDEIDVEVDGTTETTNVTSVDRRDDDLTVIHADLPPESDLDAHLGATVVIDSRGGETDSDYSVTVPGVTDEQGGTADVIHSNPDEQPL